MSTNKYRFPREHPANITPEERTKREAAFVLYDLIDMSIEQGIIDEAQAGILDYYMYLSPNDAKFKEIRDALTDKNFNTDEWIETLPKVPTQSSTEPGDNIGAITAADLQKALADGSKSSPARKIVDVVTNPKKRKALTEEEVLENVKKLKTTNPKLVDKLVEKKPRCIKCDERTQTELYDDELCSPCRRSLEDKKIRKNVSIKRNAKKKKLNEYKQLVKEAERIEARKKAEKAAKEIDSMDLSNLNFSDDDF